MSIPDLPLQNSKMESKTAVLSSPPPPPPKTAVISSPSPPISSSSPPLDVSLLVASNSSHPSPPPPVSPSPPLQSSPPLVSSPPVPVSSPPPSPSNSKSPSPPPPPSNPKSSSPSPPPPPSSSTAASPPPPSPSPSPPTPVAPNPPTSSSGGQQSPPSPSPPPPSNKNLAPTSGSPKSSPPPPPSSPQQTVVSSPVIPTPGSPPPPSNLYSPAVYGRAPPPPPITRSTKLSPPSKSAKSPPTATKSHRNPETAIAVGIAGIFVVFVIGFLFLASRRRSKRRQIIYTPHYVAPANFSMKPNGNYYVQQQSMANSGPPEAFYSQLPHSSFTNNGYESQRTNAYNGGNGGAESGVISNAKTFFSYEELMEITNGFSHQNILGEGGFGCVYKGWLPDGKVVAVKTLKAGSGQGEREFRAEVEIISRVHHRHLVSLVGYCISEQNRLLIYEFVPNKTLEHHLHGKGLPVLSWTRRVKIALGSAKGLAYLHEDCHPKIIHRDIKSANILLDDAFEAQVADFGLAKLTNDTSTHVSTRVMGTFGYLAPEYASSGKLTDRSDVFSFGVVLLELITGRKPVDTTQPLGDESLVEWARPLLIDALETLQFKDLVDPRLEKQYVESEMLRMIEAAAACIRHSAQKRPRMAQVVRSLDTESEMSDLSNGVKFGQSTMYDSGQYNQDINRFRKMALGLSKDSSEYEIYSSEYNSRELSPVPNSSNYRDTPSSESETRAFNTRSSEQNYTQPPITFNNQRF